MSLDNPHEEERKRRVCESRWYTDIESFYLYDHPDKRCPECGGVVAIYETVARGQGRLHTDMKCESCNLSVW